jgi:hypothetical protein
MTNIMNSGNRVRMWPNNTYGVTYNGLAVPPEPVVLQHAGQDFNRYAHVPLGPQESGEVLERFSEEFNFTIRVD